MTFIRGSVCRGQVALNVIHDHFWIMFLDPEADLSVQHPGFLRMEGESYFLDFMPAEDRQEMMESWYKGVKPEKLRYIPSRMPTAVAFSTEEPKREFIEHFVQSEIPAAAGEEYPNVPAEYKTEEDVLQGFRAIAGMTTWFICLMNRRLWIQAKTGQISWPDLSAPIPTIFLMSIRMIWLILAISSPVRR